MLPHHFILHGPQGLLNSNIMTEHICEVMAYKIFENKSINQ